MSGLPFFLFAWLFSGRGAGARDLTSRAEPPRPSPAPPPPSPVATPATYAPAPAPARPAATTATPAAVRYSEPVPWPQVVPAGLPGFPGAGWKPDVPVGPGVAARASQLLSQLWAHGEGTWRTEQTRGRWITYRATRMGTKKGVVAYKLDEAHPANYLERPPAEYLRAAAAPAAAPASRSRVALPTLRRGHKGASVEALQKRLGIEADGKFGPATERAVKAYQRSRGLTADGVVGRDTWTALYGSTT